MKRSFFTSMLVFLLLFSVMPVKAKQTENKPPGMTVSHDVGLSFDVVLESVLDVKFDADVGQAKQDNFKDGILIITDKLITKLPKKQYGLIYSCSCFEGETETTIHRNKDPANL